MATEQAWNSGVDNVGADGETGPAINPCQPVDDSLSFLVIISSFLMMLIGPILMIGTIGAAMLMAPVLVSAMKSCAQDLDLHVGQAKYSLTDLYVGDNGDCIS